MRPFLHYLFAAATLAIYGGEVCPFIDSLELEAWIAEMGLVFGLALLLRPAYWRRTVLSLGPEERLAGALRAEGVIFLVIAAVITFFNMAVYDFPLGSGLKIVVACVGLGFFATLDLQLAEERLLYDELVAEGRSMLPVRRYMPLTARFSVGAVVVVGVVATVVTLVVIKDMEWLGHIPPEEMAAARWAVAGEILFVALVALAHLINLSLSLSKNLNLFFKAENRVLATATSGDLDTRVTVVRNNEFGLMGIYTNRMIESLKARTEELQRTRDVTIHALASLAETRDNETGAHLLRTQRYVRALALKLRERPEYAARLDNETVDLLFKSAPLHDIGKVIFDNYFNEEYAKVVEEALRRNVWVGELEQELMGMPHAEAGYHLARKWQFPPEVIDAIRYHHQLSAAPSSSMGVVAVVHAADVLCRQIRLGAAGDHAVAPLDPAARNALGLNDDQLSDLALALDAERESIEEFAL
ncbi:MAG: HDOD domain-containing protein [Nitrospinae bacterium]|nr:HDOD domain-containing protein [Nitrospinota bacterium]